MEKGKHRSYSQKKDKQTLKNYHPVLLLPICGKILGRLLFNEIFEYFIENKLISFSQSGFKSSDSCIDQLLSITHEIYSSFDEHYTINEAFHQEFL